MKIVEVLFSLTPGGAERFVVDLSNELAKNNEVVLLTIKDDKINPDNRTFYKSELCADIQYVNLGLPDGFSFKGQWKVLKKIKELNPDIVHLNAGGLSRFCFLALLLLPCSIKVFHTIHNDLHNGYDSGFFRFFANIYGRYKRIKYITISETNDRDMRDFYPSCSFSFIQNGRAPVLPSKEFKNTQKEVNTYKHDEDTLVFLHVARCNEQKNQNLLVDSFNEVIEQGENAVLLIIGADYDNEMGETLKKKSCESIHFLGTRKNIGDYMLSSDFFCLSSVFEGMPITLLEASLVGLPAISTPVCGAVDVIQNGVNGIVSEDFSFDNYVKALLEAINLKKALSENCERFKLNSPYNIKKCAELYEKLFES